MSEAFEKLLRDVSKQALPVTLTVGHTEAVIGTLAPDGYWESGTEVLRGLAGLLEETAGEIRRRTG